MIHYQLRCADSHEFDGWFKSIASFDYQASRHLLECPHCGSADVTRAVMAPRVGGTAKPQVEPTAESPPAAPAGPAQSTAVAGAMPAEVRALLARMRREVESRCDYVGSDFATEARRIHDGDAKPRGIYGEASTADAEALADDGIEVSRIPWVPRADS